MTALLVVIALAAALPSPARGQGDPQKGAQLFARCRVCHSLEPGRNKVGPTLYALFGRRAGSLPDYAYSRAIKHSKITWSEDTLARFLADPKRFIPGNKMAFPGVKDPNRLGDLLAYLKQATR